MSEHEFPTWRRTISAGIGAAMFVAFFGMCLFATKSWVMAIIFGAVTLAVHFSWTRRRRP